MNCNNKIDNPILSSNILNLNDDKIPVIYYFNPFHLPVKKMPVKIVIEDESIKTNIKTDNIHEEGQDSELVEV
jgi:hypothetical protein